MRLQKIIANLGLTSRRKAEELIIAKKIKVNGSIAKIGDKIKQGDILEVNNKIIKYQMPSMIHARLILLYKPVGYICSHAAVTEHPLVYDLLPKLAKGKWMSVGRLDLNSQGLILVTNNGEILQRLAHPKQALKRVYKVRVRGDITKNSIEKLLSGIEYNGVVCKFSNIEKIKLGKSNSSWLVTLHEGKNREIRNMFAAVGAQVNYLKRIAYGPFKLPAELKPGKWYEIPIDVMEAKL